MKPTYQDFKEAWANEMARLCDEQPEADLDDLKRGAFDNVLKQTNDNQQDQKR